MKFDTRLAHHDIAGSIAHARMLHHVGLLKKKGTENIVAGLEAIGAEIAEGRFEWRAELEDVHMNIEAALTARVPAGSEPRDNMHAHGGAGDGAALLVPVPLGGGLRGAGRREHDLRVLEISTAVRLYVHAAR